MPFLQVGAVVVPAYADGVELLTRDPAAHDRAEDNSLLAARVGTFKKAVRVLTRLMTPTEYAALEAALQPVAVTVSGDLATEMFGGSFTASAEIHGPIRVQRIQDGSWRYALEFTLEQA